MAKALLPDVDPEGLLEYSVVYTDRSINHMSVKFQKVMKDLSSILKETYHARSSIIIPGSGTFGMEAVARQFATGKKCLTIRNGWFSYRWTQIFEAGNIPSDARVIKARRVSENGPFSPAPLDEILATIAEYKPDLVFAPHVETSAGIILPPEYIKAIGAAVHAVGGMFVLDCIASGAMWVDMVDLEVDILISAPQKGWSGSPCCAFVMLSELARGRIDGTTSSSFAVDLKKWLQIMETYESGAHAYHATMPTDSLHSIRNVMLEAQEYGLAKLKEEQQALGTAVRAMLAEKGFVSVAAEGFGAPSVVVSFTSNPQLQNTSLLRAQGIQIAAGVPLQCDEGPSFASFRIGLFGLDKWHNLDRSVASLRDGLTAAGL
jgi:aspartate aminotransferase-like enzyme